MEKKLKLEEYYSYYLSLHLTRGCKIFHLIGQFMTIFFVIWCFFSGKLAMLLFFPFVVYPFAWAGHFIFEKNNPAAFSDPARAKICDWLMFKDILTGKVKL